MLLRVTFPLVVRQTSLIFQYSLQLVHWFIDSIWSLEPYLEMFAAWSYLQLYIEVRVSKLYWDILWTFSVLPGSDVTHQRRACTSSRHSQPLGASWEPEATPLPTDPLRGLQLQTQSTWRQKSPQRNTKCSHVTSHFMMGYHTTSGGLGWSFWVRLAASLSSCFLSNSVCLPFSLLPYPRTSLSVYLDLFLRTTAEVDMFVPVQASGVVDTRE